MPADRNNTVEAFHDDESFHPEEIRLRERAEEKAVEIAAVNPARDTGEIAVLAQTINGGSYPTTSNVFYKCQVQAVYGDEAEGATATLTAGGYIYAACIGTAPPVNTQILCRYVSNRWVFQS